MRAKFNITFLILLALFASFGASAMTLPSDDVIVAPYEQYEWAYNLVEPDSSGVLDKMEKKFVAWREKEEYAAAWNLKSTGLYETPTISEKRSYLTSNGLKYLDKRLSGAMKKAPEGSALARARKVESTLKPDTSVGVSKNIKLKFRAKVIQLRGDIVVENPYVDARAEVRASGKARIFVGRNLASLGLDSQIEYSVNDGIWEAKVQKRLGRHWATQIRSAQSINQLAFLDKGSEKSVELKYHRNF